MPTGDFSYLMKPAPCFEITLKPGDMDNQYKPGMAIGYCSFTATQDTFRTYTLQTGGLGNYVLPGYKVYHKYSMGFIAITNEYSFLKRPKLSPFVGLDLYGYLMVYSDDYYAETFVQSSETNSSYIYIALIPRIGVQYKLNDLFLLSAGLGRNMPIVSTEPAGYWKSYINVSYYFF